MPTDPTGLLAALIAPILPIGALACATMINGLIERRWGRSCGEAPNPNPEN